MSASRSSKCSTVCSPVPERSRAFRQQPCAISAWAASLGPISKRARHQCGLRLRPAIACDREPGSAGRRWGVAALRRLAFPAARHRWVISIPENQGMASRTELAETSIRVHRKGTGPAVVLLHCLGVDHSLWDLAAAGLEESFTLLSYDFPGHGETPVPN